MIVILHNDSCEEIAKTAQADLNAAFQDHISVTLESTTSPRPWEDNVEWDDLLIAIYDGSDFPDAANLYVKSFLEKRKKTAQLLPVAINEKFPVPPDSASTFKALSYNENTLGVGGRLVLRAGAMLGLRLQGRETKVFISYRAADGKDIAQQIYTHLSSLGHQPWLDEAKELDGYTKILPGEPVQQEIEHALEGASLLLLVDTPQSSDSKWIKEEINTADGMLVPILPVVFRTKDDKSKGPRFRTLLALQRWVPMLFADHSNSTVLTPADLEEITQEIETYLCDIFRRKCRVPSIAEQSFKKNGYDWRALNPALLMFSSYRKISPRLQMIVHSHCSIFDRIYDPARERYRDFLKTQAQANRSLFIYDGELWPDEDVDAYLKDGMVVLHHQELSAFIASNFMFLGGA